MLGPDSPRPALPGLNTGPGETGGDETCSGDPRFHHVLLGHISPNSSLLISELLNKLFTKFKMFLPSVPRYFRFRMDTLSDTTTVSGKISEFEICVPSF